MTCHFDLLRTSLVAITLGIRAEWNIVQNDDQCIPDISCRSYGRVYPLYEWSLREAFCQIIPKTVGPIF